MDNIPKIILENPFRILGVYANSPKKDVVSNKAKATAFLKVNKAVEYPLDLKGLMPVPNRTLDIMNEAEAHLAIAKEQIKYVQYWFLKITPIDDIAFNHLVAGNISQAEEMWAKQESISSLQNKIVCYLIGKKPLLALKTAERLYDKFGDAYINKVDANSTLQMSGTELLHQFIDLLGENLGMAKLLQYDLSDSTKAYISSQTVGPLISKISTEVDKTKKFDHKDPKARIEAARKLVANTKEDLKLLREILPETDSQYQMIADKLGLEILQCGIDYYNNSEEDEAPYTAMKMQKHAQSIVVGSLAKQRCEENVRILQKIIADLPPKEILHEDRAIKKQLEIYVKRPNKISFAIALLNNTKLHLATVKNKLGVNNKVYLDLSTLVANSALHNVIEEINEIQKQKSPDDLVKCLRKAWDAILILDTFDMDTKTKETRYIPNRNILKELCDNLLPPKGTDLYLLYLDTVIKKYEERISRNYKSDFNYYETFPFDSTLKSSSKIIDAVLELLTEAQEPLKDIKKITSGKNTFYIKQSTRIASIALSGIINIVNYEQNNSISRLHIHYGSNRELVSFMQKCWNAIVIIDTMKLSKDFANHYKKNRRILENTCNSLGVETYIDFSLENDDLKWVLLGIVSGFIGLIIGLNFGDICWAIVGGCLGIGLVWKIKVGLGR